MSEEITNKLREMKAMDALTVVVLADVGVNGYDTGK